MAIKLAIGFFHVTMAPTMTPAEAVEIIAKLPWTKERVVLYPDQFDPPTKTMLTGYVAYFTPEAAAAFDEHSDAIKSLRVFKLRTADKRWLAGSIDNPAMMKATADKLAMSRASDSDIVVPSPPGKSYMPFQRAGINYARSHRNTLFGDEMGLGKTIQAIGVMNDNPDIRNVLVICPSYLGRNWKVELDQWMVNRRPVYVMDADNLERIPLEDGQKAQNGSLRSPVRVGPHVTVIGYGVLHRVIDLPEYDLLIADEAHYLKSMETKRTKAVFDIKAKRILLLSGTPALNRPVELYPLIKLLMGGRAMSKFKFEEKFCGAKPGFSGKRDNRGCSNPIQLQQYLRSNIMVRRLKKQVLTELPAKQRQVIELPPTGEVKVALDMEQGIWALHEDSLAELRLRRDEAEIAGNDEDFAELGKTMSSILTIAFHEMAKIRVSLSTLKVPFIKAHLDDAMDGNDQKFIVFFYHKEAAKALCKMLNDDGIGCRLVTGDVPMKDRHDRVEEFQTDDNVKVIVGTIGAMGTGVTLTKSSTVIMAELDWRPGIMAQAEDRAHRIGQRDSVLCQYFLFADSVDSKMIGAIIEKMENLSKVLDGDGKVEAEAKVVKKREKRPVKDWEADAKEMSPGRCGSVLEALRHIASMDQDFARQKNNKGFSRFDAGIGHRLASKDCLSKREAAFGRHLLHKYRRQLDQGHHVALWGAVNFS